VELGQSREQIDEEKMTFFFGCASCWSRWDSSSGSWARAAPASCGVAPHRRWATASICHPVHGVDLFGVGWAGAALDGADEELRQGSGSWSGEAEPPRRSLSGGASVAVEAFLGGEQVAGVGVCVNEAA
jgi:hypothetical protein